jgi:hypothetical protein
MITVMMKQIYFIQLVKVGPTEASILSVANPDSKVKV